MVLELQIKGLEIPLLNIELQSYTAKILLLLFFYQLDNNCSEFSISLFHNFEKSPI